MCDLIIRGGRLIQHAAGYVETIVAGESVVVDGEPTGRRPARVVRGAQPVAS